MDGIFVKNAHIHNLKNIDIHVPKDKIVVITGVSGSGKSSFAFDTLYEEGRKAYLKAVGLLGGAEESDYADSIEGISPTVAVKQRIIRDSNPRSVVGTKTRILDYLRLLYATNGIGECSGCGTPLGKEYICNKCGSVEKRLSPSFLSFNSIGMCLECKGKGYVQDISLNRLITNSDDTVAAICSRVKISPMMKNELVSLMQGLDFKWDTPFGLLEPYVQDIIINGSEDRFRGIIPFLKWKIWKGKPVEDLLGKCICKSCGGYRLGDEGLSLKLNGKHIGQLSKMTVSELREFMQQYSQEPDLPYYGRHMCNIISDKIERLIGVGLSHLSLYREVPTLSGGEIQRLFLMSHLDSQIEGVTYIFDEPTAGLHELEKDTLLNKFNALKDLGNSVIIVEHDKNVLGRAEHIIDFGPMAGKNGGQVIYQGSLKGFLDCRASVTARYLAGRMKLPRCETLADTAANSAMPMLRMKNVRVNNLKNVSLDIPLGMMVGIAGVSGSGKSSLVYGSLIPLLKKKFKGHGSDSESRNGEVSGDIEEDGQEFMQEAYAGELTGYENIDGFADISQLPVGRNKRSILLTYLGIWDKIREIYKNQPKAVELGYNESFFSFNSSGACTQCRGIGINEITVGGIEIMLGACPVCGAKRFNPQVLQVEYKGKSIADVLDMTVSEGVQFFSEVDEIRFMLETLNEVGMGYIGLGQPITTFSGGEAQRIKLACKLGRKYKGKYLYILDEPTTGLSYYDIEKLVLILYVLIKKDNSVLIIEHDPEVLSLCNWIIELGPGGGSEGGEIIAQGTPLAVMNNCKSKIGTYLLK